MAYAAFANAPIEVGVIEVGLGGTWDSTNVVDPQVAVITPIGIDHADYLGDTFTEIAGEKAGIIKPDSIVVIGAQDADAMKVLLRRAVEVDATVARFGSEFAVTSRRVAVGGQRLTLQGLGGVTTTSSCRCTAPHQAENASLALAAVEAFFGAGRDRQLDVVGVQDGFAAVASPGRLERVGTNPTVLVDAAHNPHGATALATAIADEFAFSHLVGVLAVMADKDVDGILTALADTLDEVVVTANSSPRSMPAADLATLAEGVFGTERVHRRRDRCRGIGSRPRPGRRSRRDGRRHGRTRCGRAGHRFRRHRRRHPRAGRAAATMTSPTADPVDPTEPPEGADPDAGVDPVLRRRSGAGRIRNAGSAA